MNNSRLITLGGAGALAALLAGGIVSVYADDDVPGATLTQEPGTHGTHGAHDAEHEAMHEGVGGQHRGQHGHGQGAGATREELAAFLGLDAAALEEALASGQTLAQIAEANGKSREDLKAFLVDEATAAINEAVASGKLTQEQADEKLAQLDERIEAKLDGQMRGRGGPRGMSGPTPGGASFSYRGLSGSTLY